VSSEGNPTYEAKDMALQVRKMHDWPADLLVITTASEQNGYFEVVFAALEKLDPKFSGRLKHIGFGMINLTSGKMSSRTGNIVSAIDLVDQVVAAVSEKSADTAEAVGVGAIKYAFLKKAATQDMEFDLQSSISIEGNSGPYLQYTYARAQSVLKKAANEPIADSSEAKMNSEELRLVRWMYRYPEVVSEAASKYAPNLLTNFLYELAQRYNTFYNKHQIVGSELRIKLTQTVGEILEAGLTLLGITALERM
jgi:arginyl-tRNA synthetase